QAAVSPAQRHHFPPAVQARHHDHGRLMRIEFVARSEQFFLLCWYFLFKTVLSGSCYVQGMEQKERMTSR
ncbi:hypothetical protein DYN53_23905, partial [Salmonella enterica subsp. enterica serovar Enteritidis]|nr:hypothetical protein [Salmonella enterica subsp. enterica serovar Enteritidis]